MAERGQCPRCQKWYMPGAKYCSNLGECGIGLSDHAIHMELSYMPTRKDREWLLGTYYGLSEDDMNKFLPCATRQSTKNKSKSKLILGNKWVKDRMARAKIALFAGHFDRFDRNAECRASMVSQGAGRILFFTDNKGNFDRFADQEFFDKKGIDVNELYKLENAMTDLGEYLQGYGDDLYEPLEIEVEPDCELPAEGAFYTP
jgi:hypothetical protein